MTTTLKSKCCGAALIFNEGVYRCYNCGEICTLQDQPTSRLDEDAKTIKQIDDIAGYLTALHQSLAKANEELVELRKDKARLDWLESDIGFVVVLSDIPPNKILTNRNLRQSSDELRQAIDSAIAAQEKMK